MSKTSRREDLFAILTSQRNISIRVLRHSKILQYYGQLETTKARYTPDDQIVSRQSL